MLVLKKLSLLASLTRPQRQRTYKSQVCTLSCAVTSMRIATGLHFRRPDGADTTAPSPPNRPISITTLGQGQPPSVAERSTLSTELALEVVSAVPAGVVTAVRSERELKLVPYWQQGDEDMLLVLQKRARRNNRTAGNVIAALQAFWDSVLYDPECPEIPREAADTATISRSRYIEVFTRIASVLDPSEVNTAVWIQEAAAAWAQDTNGDSLTCGPLPKSGPLSLSLVDCNTYVRARL